MKATEPCTVHCATVADLDEIMRLLRIMHQEGGMFPLDEDCAQQMFMRALRNKNKEGLLGIIRGEGVEIKAMIFLLITRFWYSTAYHIEELFNFVHPDHRHSNYADALLRFAGHSSEQLGIPLIIGVLTNARMAAKVRLYRRRLGMPVGAVFVKNATWINERATDVKMWEHGRGGRRKKMKAA